MHMVNSPFLLEKETTYFEFKFVKMKWRSELYILITVQREQSVICSQSNVWENITHLCSKK